MNIGVHQFEIDPCEKIDSKKDHNLDSFRGCVMKAFHVMEVLKNSNGDFNHISTRS